jgi:tRNA (guanine37-N1)-methyltransferase
MMKFHIVSIFPNSFESYLGESLLRRAREKKVLDFKFYNPIDFSDAKNSKGGIKKTATYADKRVDDRPYGGGPGMVMEALPVARAIDSALKKIKNKKKAKVLLMSPRGKQFDNKLAEEYANKYSDLILVSGRYEGIDSRIQKMFKMEEVSVGPYVLTGGELPAMIIIDSVSRRVDGVIGDKNSLEENRSASPEMYTRPEVFKWKNKNYRVPKILLSGNHKLIEEWRANKNEEKEL